MIDQNQFVLPGDLYGSLMSEGNYASRMLMHENAFNRPATPTRARKSGPSERVTLWMVRCSRHFGIWAAAPAAPDRVSLEAITMLDFVMIALGVGFFVAAVLYVLACERM